MNNEVVPPFYYFTFMYFDSYDASRDIFNDALKVEVLAADLEDAKNLAAKLVGNEKRRDRKLLSVIVKSERTDAMLVREINPVTSRIVA